MPSNQAPHTREEDASIIRRLNMGRLLDEYNAREEAKKVEQPKDHVVVSEAQPMVTSTPKDNSGWWKRFKEWLNAN